MTSHGSITVEEGCTKAASDYPDIDTGTQVTITDSSGNVISTGSLGYSHGPRLGFTSGPGSFGGECVYPFSVQVPGGLPRYGITIARRGPIYFSASQMAKGPGLTLGS